MVGRVGGRLGFVVSGGKGSGFGVKAAEGLGWGFVRLQ